MRYIVLAAIGVLAIVGATGSDAAQYRIVDLGVGKANCINNCGQVVGFTPSVNLSSRAVLWQGGETTPLGDSGNVSWANGINNNGQVVGYQIVDGAGYAYLWHDGEATSLGTLMPDLSQSGGLSEAFSINDSGVAVGRSFVGSHALGFFDGFTWTNGEMSEIATSFASDINSSNQVVGYLNTDGNSYGVQNCVACAIAGGSTTTIALPGSNNTYGRSNNDLGDIVGYYFVGQVTDTGMWSAGYAHAFLRHNGITSDLGTLGYRTGGSYPNSYAYSINNRGQIVGRSNTTQGEMHACIYDGGEWSDLGTLAGGSLSSAYCINDNGWICGYSQDQFGAEHAVMWVPVPEPTSVLSLLCGVAGWGGVVRKRR